MTIYQTVSPRTAVNTGRGEGRRFPQAPALALLCLAFGL